MATSTTQDLAGDRLAASTVVIQPTDAGPAFKGKAHDRLTDLDLGSCVKSDPVLSGTDYPTQADGQDLSNSSGHNSTEVQSSVRVAPTVGAAVASMAAIKAPGVTACITELAKTLAAANGVIFTGATGSPVVVPVVGDDVFGSKMVVNITQPAGVVPTTEYDLLIRKGRVLISLAVTGRNTVPPLSLVTTLAATMATRAATIH